MQKFSCTVFLLFVGWATVFNTSLYSQEPATGSVDTLREGVPHEVGLSDQKLTQIDSIVTKAISDSVFPGAVVGVVKDGVLAYHRAFGYQTYDQKRAVKKDDVYDLASITKVMATTASVMKLTDEGLLHLNDPVSTYIAEFDTEEKKDITIKDLLLHQSGLPAFRVYVDSIQTRKEIVHAIKNEPLINEPGAKYVYSDLGMILLAEIVHQVSGSRLDEYARDTFYEPMGMKHTMFNPHEHHPELLENIAPTENDTVYGRGLVHGYAHDERAYFMDGVAGHAGLFSSLPDIAKFTAMLMNNGTYRGIDFLKPETIRMFTTKQSELSGRGFGFDRKSGEGFSTAGNLAGIDTFGHLGFTGTSFWIDREKNMAVILLTNRTYPFRSFGRTISGIRAAVADAAYSAIITP